MVKENFPQSYDVIANNKPINYKLQYFTHIKIKTSIQKTAFFSSLTMGKIRAKYFPMFFQFFGWFGRWISPIKPWFN